MIVVPDLLAENLSLVLCGTAPSRVSKELQAYYAHPGNIFWKTLHEVGLTPHLVAPRNYPDVLKFGIGLTDLNKSEWGADSELSAAGFDVAAFTEKMRLYQPRVIAFTSKFTAGKFLDRKAIVYGLQPETLFGSALFVVPSTSGRARSYFDIAPWRALAKMANG